MNPARDLPQLRGPMALAFSPALHAAPCPVKLCLPFNAPYRATCPPTREPGGTRGIHLRWLRDRSRSRGNTVRSHDGDAGRKVWRAELDPESHQIVGNAMDALVDETWRAGHPKDAPAPPVSELARLRACLLYTSRCV